MNMLKVTTSAIVLGMVLLAAAMPASAQPEANPRQQEIDQQIQDQIERGVQELFDDFNIQEGEAGELRERLLDIKERHEALRLIQLHQQRPGIEVQSRVADPVQLDAKPLVDPWMERSRDEVVAALNDKDFEVRESAQAHLLTDDTLDQRLLKSLIERAESPEQQQRLLNVAEHHLLREMRLRDFGKRQAEPVDDPINRGFAQPRAAAVGYSYEPVLSHENPHEPLAGVRVIATMPGFPGHAHLRRGDIIVQIAGQRPAVNYEHHEITQWVRWRISDHAAGDTISFVVIRGGEFVAIDLVCAEGQALDHMYTTDAFETAVRKEPYGRAWEKFRDELLQATTKPKVLTPKPLAVTE